MEKILIVYASKTGTAKDAAKAIKERLSTPSDTYDCRNRVLTEGDCSKEKIKLSAIDLNKYGLIVIGTAMYIGKPIKEIAQFCMKYETELKQKKIILFTCGVGKEEEDKEYLWRHLPAALTNAALFYRHLGGEIREDKLNTFERMAMREYVRQHGPATGINAELVKDLSLTIEKAVSQKE